MQLKAIEVISEIDNRLEAESDGRKRQRWREAKAEMSKRRSTAKLIPYLPKRLGRAVDRHRKQRLIAGQSEEVFQPV